MSPQKSIAQRLLHGGQLATIGKFVGTAAALLLNALLTRLLPPESVGAYYILVSIVVVGTQVSLLGGQQAIVRLLGAGLTSDDPTAPRRALKSTLLVVVSGIMIVGASYAFIVGEWLGPNIFDSTLIATTAGVTAVWIIFRSIQNFISQTFLGFHQLGRAAFFEQPVSMVILVTCVSTLWVLGRPVNLNDILLLTVFSLGTTGVIGGALLLRHYKQTPASSGLEVNNVLQICLPLFIATFALNCVSEFNLWILGSMESEEVVAIFGAAFRLATFVVAPLLIVNSIIPPIVAQLYAQQRQEDLVNVLRLTATIAAIPSVIIVLILGLGAEPILSLLFGPHYGQGATILITLLAAQAINAITGSPGVLLAMSGHQKIVMGSAVAAGLSGLTTTALLVPAYGGEGAALGVFIGKVSHNLIMLVYCRKKLGIKTHVLIFGMKAAFKLAASELRGKGNN